ncbi:MAG: excinuclease ABC subunit UvrC [Oscillospiraceae bacterium]|nr:excinuclease ABC subunit UvrC [Oscillospiraceae bacterium]
MNPRLEYLREKTALLTTSPGVYQMKDEEGGIIYIGKAKNLRNRVSSYFAVTPDHTPKVAAMVENVYDYDFIVVKSEYEALVLECSMIKQHKPKYNILLKDDKGYSYIHISDPPYPRITGVLKKQDSGRHLGPYMSSFVARRTAEEVNHVFKLPTCNKVFPRDFGKGRPCLNFHIGQCMGVCRGKISEAEYAAVIAEAEDYIKSGSAKSVERMTELMERYAENLEFEKAAAVRDRINAVRRAADAQTIIEEALPDTDAVAVARNGGEICAAVIMYRGGRLADRAEFFLGEEFAVSGEGVSAVFGEFLTQYYSGLREIPRQVVLYNEIEDMDNIERLLRERSGHAVDVMLPQKGRYLRLAETAWSNAGEYLSIRVGRTSKEIAALEELSDLLGLDKTPEYIESYDISNLGSEDMVAGMIVFENGRPAKKYYKRFSIKENLVQNDLACMQEVLRRRFRHYLDPNETDEGFKRMPDLILLDGGENQLNAVREVMAQMKIHTNVFGMVKDGNHRTRAITSDGGEIGISQKQAAFLLVTRIQDEVHRYAITYQRKRHRASTLTSGLTSIKGIGEKKAAALMGEFKTTDRLKAAAPEEIAPVIKVNTETAAKVCDYIRDNL